MFAAVVVVATPAVASDAFEAATVAKGAQLAALGNCETCHTAEGGKPYAGGRALSTPVGVIYSTNITPDAETGIGRWTESDFRRAMHEGIARDGRELYPAFPYDHFTKVYDEDVRALYAFVMTRDPVRVADRPRNDVKLFARFRSSVVVWKALHFRPGRFVTDPSKDSLWNRGAYLAEGLAHCGACHTPRNVFGAKQQQRAYDGGDVDDWLAPAINAQSPAPLPWTSEQLFRYLRDGHDASHGTASGPMRDVVRNLATVSADDVRAIAVYFADRMQRTRLPSDATSTSSDRQEFSAVAGKGKDAPHARDGSVEIGAVIFEGACATCHYAGTGLLATKPVPLALTTSVNAPDPRNLIHVVQNGIWPERSDKGALMPGFAAELTDDQMVALVNYVRGRFSRQPPWRDVASEVRAIRAASEDNK